MNENKVAKAVKEGTEKYKSYLQAVHGKEMLCLHPKDLETVHKEAVQEAAKVFDSKRKQFLNVKDEERATFLEVYLFFFQSLNVLNILCQIIIKRIWRIQ